MIHFNCQSNAICFYTPITVLNSVFIDKHSPFSGTSGLAKTTFVYINPSFGQSLDNCSTNPLEFLLFFLSFLFVK